MSVSQIPAAWQSRVYLALYAKVGASSALNVNQELAAAVIEAAENLPVAGPASLSRLEVLQWPGVVASAETDMDAINGDFLAEFDLTLKDFIASRADEGVNLGD